MTLCCLMMNQTQTSALEKFAVIISRERLETHCKSLVDVNYSLHLCIVLLESFVKLCTWIFLLFGVKIVNTKF